MKQRLLSMLALLLMAVTGTWAQTPEDIIITPESGDIAAALAAATDGKQVENITINLAKGGEYTIGSTIVIPNSIVINGNGATIDASGLSGDFIQLATGASPDIDYVCINGTNIKGLKAPLFYSTENGHLIGMLSIDNCVIEVATDVIPINFTKGSVARNVSIENSTIYAPAPTTKSFYSSQSGEKLTAFDPEGTQTFTINSCTMYNLATGKNFFTHRQNSQNWEAYTATNSIFVNCGKSGAAIIGMNGGGASANPTWTIDSNAFNFVVDNEMTDTSAGEQTGDTNEDEMVKNSVAGIVAFTDAANGDFTLGDCAAKTAQIGDTRWITASTGYSVKLADGTEDAANWAITPSTAPEGETVTVKYNGSKKVLGVRAVKKTAVPTTTPLTMECLEDGTIMVYIEGELTTGMQYAKNGGTKTKITTTTTIEGLKKGDKVQFYGVGTDTQVYGNNPDVSISGGTAQVKVYGNIMSLLDEDNFATKTDLPNKEDVFYGLFAKNAKLTDASGLLLPATTLTEGCYGQMFDGCSALTTAPALPATTLADYCYYGLFYKCSALTAAPALPATTLADYCYYAMFYNCSKLASVTCKATNVTATQCLSAWLGNAGTDASVTTRTLYVEPSMIKANWQLPGYWSVAPISGN